METQKELIQYHEGQFIKIMQSHGLVDFKSDATTAAFFRLQAAKIGIHEKDITNWAIKKTEELNEEAIAVL